MKLAAALVVCALLAPTAAAYADDNDALFLKTIRTHTRYTPGHGDDADLIAEGHWICGRLQSGHSRTAVHDYLVTRDGMPNSDADWWITASVGAYCPDAGKMGPPLKLAAALAVWPIPLAPFTSGEQAYLNQLRTHGVAVKDEQSAVNLGHDACTLLSEGESESTLTRGILVSSPDLGESLAKVIIDAAVTYLCPSQRR